ncbi:MULTISPECIES: TadA family conjugal transfer-associated ATPase [unclassified Cryobacterium]|uniref:TadA family conjugal transfer-associated ATPase n=1 Tax=unclassified Cryobacterium TaxID=2649013 RepID=UPI00106A1CCA|nr:MULTISPECIES: TadA family conjugal transfer-associated ATPase [unclassified Cryobacterium]TFD18081.1 TadA family conjugal transfer-associated ATPase [Cryobacterium sp. TMT4-10]TFD18566.1 TadA family conjugal transfer-associated ATPase [Cryobacterium sp. TMT2-23]
MPSPFIAVPSYAAQGAAPAGPTLEGAARDTPSPDAPAPDQPALDVSGLGPLARFAAARQVTDLFVNGEAGLWVDAGHGLVREPGWACPETQVRELAVRLIALGGRHIDEASPCVDVRLSDGIRVHAVLPPASSTGTLLSIRLPRAARPSLAALAQAGLFGPGEEAVSLVQRLRAAVHHRENLLITGAAGSGKTTLLAALLGEAPPGERIVVIEDVAELRIDHPHVVALESRQANLEGAGRIGLDSLLREALRMRPDRLVLGECRGGEIRELLAALNTGHDGGAGTLHANSVRDIPARLEALGALAGMSPEAVARQAVSAIGLVLHLERRDGLRRLAPPARFALDGHRLVTVPVEREERGQGAATRGHGRRAAAAPTDALPRDTKPRDPALPRDPTPKDTLPRDPP